MTEKQWAVDITVANTCCPWRCDNWQRDGVGWRVNGYKCMITGQKCESAKDCPKRDTEGGG